MSAFYVCSADRPDAEDLVAVPAGEHQCSDGWLDDDPEGRPRPCRTCRPWLTPDTSKETLPMTRRVQPCGALTPSGEAADAWLQRVLAWAAPPTLGRAAWRPRAVALAAWASPGQRPTLEELAQRLKWKPTLVARHAEVAVAAGLLAIVDEADPA
jgi:hypothetical protein